MNKTLKVKLPSDSTKSGMLIFDMSDAFGQNDYMRAVTADSAYNVVWTLQNNVLRNLAKYGCDDSDVQTAYDMVDHIRTKLQELIDESDMNLDWYN